MKILFLHLILSNIFSFYYISCNENYSTECENGSTNFPLETGTIWIYSSYVISSPPSGGWNEYHY
jgi:hypothetical protein